jgi:hypothetical protein
MRLFANCKVAMTMLVAFFLLSTQVEPGALAQSQQSTPPPSTTTSQTPAPPETAPKTGQSQTKPRSGHRRLKWLLVGAAVVGGVAAAILIKNKKGPEPVVTIGGPTLGNPQ